MNLKNLLTHEEYQTVAHVAEGRFGSDQLPIVAWALGFVNLEQLDALLSGKGQTITVQSQRPQPQLP
jgi:hypothetical protein